MRNLIIATFCLIAIDSSAQIKFEESTSNDSRTFIDLEKEFQDWSNGKDLSIERGWKWYKRWEEHYAQRANGDGSLVDQKIFLEEATKYLKQQKAPYGQKSSWIPIGPDYKPSSPNPYSSHGVARINCIEFHPTDPNTFWIGTSQGGIWKTNNSGASWTPISDGLPILRISDIEVDPNNTDIIYACVGDFEYNGVALNLDDRKRHTHYGIGLYKTIDGGANWSATGLTVAQTDLDYSLLRRSFVDPANSNNVIAAGFEGIWLSNDAGASWSNTLPDRIICDLEMDPNNPQVLYAASAYLGLLNDGTTEILKSTDFGATWTVLNSGLAANEARRMELAIAPSNSNYIYALVVNDIAGLHGVYRSTDGGSTWNQQCDGTTNILAWSEGVGEVGGQGWYDLGLLVDPNDPNVVHVGGVNIWGSANGGVTWNAEAYWLPYYGPSVHADQHQFKYNSVDDKFYVCNDGGIYRTDSMIISSWDYVNNGGNWPTVWEDLSDGMQITSFYRLSVSQLVNGAVLAGAQDNSTYYYNGNYWSNVIGGDGMECSFSPSDADMFIGSWQYGGLALTTDGGQSFDYSVADQLNSSEAGEWTTPFFYSEDGYLYAAFGNLYRSSNNGASWQPLSNFPDVPALGYPVQSSALKQSKNNPGTFYLAKRILHSQGEPASLHVTFDGGGTWTDITNGLPDSLYFTYIAVDDDDPNLAWVTCSGFEDGVKIFKTSNGGQSWQNVSDDLPNIPVNCVIVDETSAMHTLFIGTDLGVYTRQDGDAGWTLYSTNLPNVIISELEIDYNNSELYAATFGRGLWKTSVVLGTEELDSKYEGAELSPNPNAGSFVLGLNAKDQSDVLLTIIDIKGSVVYSETLQTEIGLNQVGLDLNLLSGMYFLKLTEGKQSKALKFIVE